MLVSCKFAMKVWKLSTLAAYVTNSPHMDFALFAKNLESWLSKEATYLLG